MTCAAVRVTVAQTKGSTPRDVGAEMLIWGDRQSGSIGGGMLEFEAAKQAREMLANGPQKMQMEQSLGPDLGQCCGGHVMLEFEQMEKGTMTAPENNTPLWIFGAGHVGRALVQILAPMARFDITLIDTSTARMPTVLPNGVTAITNAQMQSLVSQAPANAHHFIMTMSHGFDLEICDALLNHRFAYAGLIGSKTKWARFRTKLKKRGHSADDIKRITCPIGDPTLGKEPQAIAVGISHGLLLECTKTESEADIAHGAGEI